MSNLSGPETDLLRTLVRRSGRDATGFQALALPNASIRVLGPQGAAVYRLDGWQQRFVQHLQQGYFDGHPPAVRANGTTSAAGGTG